MPLLKWRICVSLCIMKEIASATKMPYLQMPPLGRKSFAVPAGYTVWNDRGLVLGKRVCGHTNRKPFFTWFEMPPSAEAYKNQQILNTKIIICISIIMQILFAGLKSAAQNHIIHVQGGKLHVINSRSGGAVRR